MWVKSAQWVTGARLAAGAQDRVKCARERPEWSEGGGSSGNLERYSWNKGKHYAGGHEHGGDRGHPKGEGGHGGRTPVAIWEAATGAADPPPSTRLEVLVFHPSKHPLHLGQKPR